MVNLYQILGLPIDATTVEINVALRKYQQLPQANPKIVRAVDEWLLVGETRKRYNARLRAEQPDFFEQSEYEIAEEDIADYDTESECEYDFFDTYTPQLWSPKQVILAAALVSPVFGAMLYALNWRELGRHDCANQALQLAKRFVWLHLALAVVAVLTGWAWVLLLGGVGAVFLWFKGGGEQQHDFVQHKMGQFIPKMWRNALLCALGGWFVYLLAAFFMLLFAVLLGLA